MLLKENVLSNPGLVTDRDCVEYLTLRGKGWVCEADGTIVGFAIADLIDNNIWALFVHPDHEGKGNWEKYYTILCSNWYFSQQKEMVWLSTDPGYKSSSILPYAGLERNGPVRQRRN